MQSQTRLCGGWDTLGGKTRRLMKQEMIEKYTGECQEWRITVSRALDVQSLRLELRDPAVNDTDKVPTLMVQSVPASKP